MRVSSAEFFLLQAVIIVLELFFLFNLLNNVLSIIERQILIMLLTLFYTVLLTLRIIIFSFQR